MLSARCLSVKLVYYGQTVEWIKMKLRMPVGLATWYGGRPQLRRLCVRWGPARPKGARPQFSAHAYCGQTVARLSYC